MPKGNFLVAKYPKYVAVLFVARKKAKYGGLVGRLSVYRTGFKKRQMEFIYGY